MCNAKNPHWVEKVEEEKIVMKTDLTMEEIEKRMEDMSRSWTRFQISFVEDAAEVPHPSEEFTPSRSSRKERMKTTQSVKEKKEVETEVVVSMKMEMEVEKEEEDKKEEEEKKMERVLKEEEEEEVKKEEEKEVIQPVQPKHDDLFDNTEIVTPENTPENNFHTKQDDDFEDAFVEKPKQPIRTNRSQRSSTSRRSKQSFNFDSDSDDFVFESTPSQKSKHDFDDDDLVFSDFD